MAQNESNANRRTALLAAAQSMVGLEYSTDDILGRAVHFERWLINDKEEKENTSGPYPRCTEFWGPEEQAYEGRRCMRAKGHAGAHTNPEGQSWRTDST